MRMTTHVCDAMSVSPDAPSTKDALKREYAREELDVSSEDEIKATCTTYTISCLEP